MGVRNELSHSSDQVSALLPQERVWLGIGLLVLAAICFVLNTYDVPLPFMKTIAEYRVYAPSDWRENMLMFVLYCALSILLFALIFVGVSEIILGSLLLSRGNENRREVAKVAQENVASSLFSFRSEWILQDYVDHATRRKAMAWSCSLQTILLFAFGFLFYPDLGLPPLAASLALLYFLSVSLLAAYFWHRWAITLMKLLYAKVTYDRSHIDENGDPLDGWEGELGNRPCGYCGNSNAPIYCGNCNTIQWMDLNPLRTDRHPFLKELNFLWTASAFINYHRWRILASIMPIALVGAIGFGIKIKEDQWRLREERTLLMNQEMSAVIDAMAKFRSSLLAHHSQCPPGQDREPTTSCQKLFAEIQQAFFTLSWYAPGLLKRLRQERCSGWDPNAPPLIKDLQSHEAARWHACNLIYRKQEALDEPKSAEWKPERQEIGQYRTCHNEDPECTGFTVHLDARYRGYMNAYLNGTPESMRKPAHALYADGRIMGCIIASLDRRGAGMTPENQAVRTASLSDCAAYMPRWWCGNSYCTINHDRLIWENETSQENQNDRTPSGQSGGCPYWPRKEKERICETLFPGLYPGAAHSTN